MRYEFHGNETRGMAGTLEPRRSRHFLCSPEQYYHKAMQHVIAANRRHRDQAWIFDLISGAAKHEREVIYIDTDQWLLCSHPESDVRFLVVFKDLRLHSIRDLRHEHIPMLRDVNRQVAAFLRARSPKDVRSFKFFFHYMPSVFQLHMHVCLQHTGDTLRIHSLQSVLHRLDFDDLWFRRALILCPLPRVFGHLHFDGEGNLH
jgi:m7GpppX diphosphatase